MPKRHRIQQLISTARANDALELEYMHLEFTFEMLEQQFDVAPPYIASNIPVCSG